MPRLIRRGQKVKRSEDLFFLGGLKDLIVRICIILKFVFQFVIFGGKSIDTVSEHSKSANYDPVERNKQYNEMISEHRPGEYESSIRNLMLFDFMILGVGLAFLIMGAISVSAHALIFGVLVFMFGVLCLGYPVFIVRNRVRISYSEFMNEIFKKGKVKQAFPSFNIQIRG